MNFPTYFPKIAKDLVQKILKKNPLERFSLLQIKNHSWLCKVKQVKSKKKSQINPKKQKSSNLEKSNSVMKILKMKIISDSKIVNNKYQTKKKSIPKERSSHKKTKC